MDNFTSFADESFKEWNACRQTLLFIEPKRQWLWALDKCGIEPRVAKRVQQLSNYLGITKTLEHKIRD